MTQPVNFVAMLQGAARIPTTASTLPQPMVELGDYLPSLNQVVGVQVLSEPCGTIYMMANADENVDQSVINMSVSRTFVDTNHAAVVSNRSTAPISQQIFASWVDIVLYDLRYAVESSHDSTKWRSPSVGDGIYMLSYWIGRRIRRGWGNVVVIPEQLLPSLSSMPEFSSTADVPDQHILYHAGTLKTAGAGSIVVMATDSQRLISSDGPVILVGYRGDQITDVGYVAALHIPNNVDWMSEAPDTYIGGVWNNDTGPRYYSAVVYTEEV